MKFRSKVVEKEAHLWRANGDHPEDGDEHFIDDSGTRHRCEGKVVRYFRHPNVDGRTPCRNCKLSMFTHGWIDTLEGGHIVCPGDWIIRGVKGEFYPCKPDIFELTYEAVP